MKNTVKIGLGVLAGGIVYYLSRYGLPKKNGKLVYTAPDGNEYFENQVYRTAEGDLYKNGRKMRVDIPVTENMSSQINDSTESIQQLSASPKPVTQEVSYHQRGIRHH